MIPEQLWNKIVENEEWLETTEGDEVWCVSLEELKGILEKWFKEEPKY